MYDIWFSRTEDDLRRVLRRFAQLGAVVLADVTDVPAASTFGLSQERGGTVELTALGAVGVQRLAGRKGIEVPVAGRYRDATAQHLLEALAGVSDQDIEAEVATWLEGTDPLAAAADISEALVRVLAAAEDDLGRFALVSVALSVWQLIGTDAADAVRTVAAHPVAGPFAAAWLELKGQPGPPVNPGPLMVGLGVIDPEAAVEKLCELPSDEQIALLEMARAERWPGTELYLSSIAERHPEKAVAKTARRNLFRLRSGGGRR